MLKLLGMLETFKKGLLAQVRDEPGLALIREHQLPHHLS